jgi:hypothetical protein
VRVAVQSCLRVLDVSGYEHKSTLPPETVRAIFSLRDTGVVNMKYSNGKSTHKFGKSPIFISPHAMSDSHFSFSQIRTILCCRNFHDRSGKTGQPQPPLKQLIGCGIVMDRSLLPKIKLNDLLCMDVLMLLS